jgi:predicted MPP superfamily phosphohydrolase
LANQNVVIKRGSKSLVLAGINDLGGDVPRSLNGAAGDAVKILLAHQPRAYKAAAQAGVHLQLSGHTHGGQFFPWSLIVALAQRYYKGLSKFENTWIYVNRGTGYWGPPIRFAIPAEISFIRLVPAPGGPA